MLFKSKNKWAKQWNKCTQELLLFLDKNKIFRINSLMLSKQVKRKDKKHNSSTSFKSAPSISWIWEIEKWLKLLSRNSYWPKSINNNNCTWLVKTKISHYWTKSFNSANKDKLNLTNNAQNCIQKFNRYETKQEVKAEIDIRKEK